MAGQMLIKVRGSASQKGLNITAHRLSRWTTLSAWFHPKHVLPRGARVVKQFRRVLIARPFEKRFRTLISICSAMRNGGGSSKVFSFPFGLGNENFALDFRSPYWYTVQWPGWRYFAGGILLEVTGILLEVFFRWPDGGPVGGIWPGIWPGWRYFFGGISPDGPVLARQYASSVGTWE